MRASILLVRLVRLASSASLACALQGCGAPPAPAHEPAAPPETTRAAVGDGAQQFAELGTCPLESGERIEGCRVGYRTFGKLDAARSNAILFPTYFTGTTGDIAGVVPNKLVDTGRFYLILVDALGDGVSSSPSNSKTQPRLRFPKFTTGDMVESQTRVLDSLGIQTLHAVMGISMGGMQAFAWGMRHPERVARVVSIVGTPQLTSQDLLLWSAELHALDSDVAYKNGEYEGRPQLRTVNDLHALMLSTPAYRAQQTSREAFPAWMAEVEKSTAFDWNDWHRQLEAMLAHDLFAPFGGSVTEAGNAWKPRALVIVAEQDHMVSPLPSKAFAAATKAELVVLEGPCGHLSPNCETAKLSGAIAAFLAQ